MLGIDIVGFNLKIGLSLALSLRVMMYRPTVRKETKEKKTKKKPLMTRKGLYRNYTLAFAAIEVI